MNNFKDFKDFCQTIEDREDQYSYLIDLGKELPTYKNALRTNKYLITGCASKGYVHLSWVDDKFIFQADSDSAIIKGVLYLLYDELSNHTQEELSQIDLKKSLTEAGLFGLLTSQRQNGLATVINTVNDFIK